jgi:hypothetical protein
MATETEHEHKFKMTTHMDGCHFHETLYACTVACGQVARVMHERDPKADPYSLIWMEPTYETVNRDERGRFVKPHEREHECKRCSELRAGAPTRHELVVFDAKGNVVKEEFEEHEQGEGKEGEDG